MKLLEPLTDKHGKCWPACPGLRARPGSRGPGPASRKQDVCGRHLPGADSECWHCPLAWGPQPARPRLLPALGGPPATIQGLYCRCQQMGVGKAPWEHHMGYRAHYRSETWAVPNRCCGPFKSSHPGWWGYPGIPGQAGGKVGSAPLPWPRSDGDTGRSSLPPHGLFSTPLGSSPSGCLACTPRHITPSPRVSL